MQGLVVIKKSLISKKKSQKKCGELVPRPRRATSLTKPRACDGHRSLRSTPLRCSSGRSAPRSGAERRNPPLLRSAPSGALLRRYSDYIRSFFVNDHLSHQFAGFELIIFYSCFYSPCVVRFFVRFLFRSNFRFRFVFQKLSLYSFTLEICFFWNSWYFFS